MSNSLGAAEATVPSLVTFTLPDMAATFMPIVYSVPVPPLAYRRHGSTAPEISLSQLRWSSSVALCRRALLLTDNNDANGVNSRYSGLSQ